MKVVRVTQHGVPWRVPLRVDVVQVMAGTPIAVPVAPGAWAVSVELIDPLPPSPHRPHACRLMPTRGCPASYGGPCGDRPCARFESDDESPWLAEIAVAQPCQEVNTPTDVTTLRSNEV